MVLVSDDMPSQHSEPAPMFDSFLFAGCNLSAESNNRPICDMAKAGIGPPISYRNCVLVYVTASL
jgi:hypothetical protein